MDEILRAIMTDKLGQLMMANTELAATNVTLSKTLEDQVSQIKAKDILIDTLKLELEAAKLEKSQS